VQICVGKGPCAHKHCISTVYLLALKHTCVNCIPTHVTAELQLKFKDEPMYQTLIAQLGFVNKQSIKAAGHAFKFTYYMFVMCTHVIVLPPVVSFQQVQCLCSKDHIRKTVCEFVCIQKRKVPVRNAASKPCFS